MPLPARMFWSVIEVAARWGVMPADVAGWAAMGKLEIITSVPPVRCDGHGTLAGLMVVNVADILPMFRRCGSGPSEYWLHRIRPLGATEEPRTWMAIAEPGQGVTISLADLMLTGAEVERFEDECALTKRGPGNPGGPREKYQWDEFYIAVIKRVHDEGLPETQQELVAEMQEWFVRRADGFDVPDESTIRRRIKPIWAAVREV